MPPKDNEPNEIVDHHVKTRALYVSSTFNWIRVWVPIPIKVVENPIKRKDIVKINTFGNKTSRGK